MRNNCEPDRAMDLEIDANKIDQVFDRYPHQVYELSSDDWQSILGKVIRKKRVGRREWLARLFRYGRNGRSQDKVASTYDELYSSHPSTQKWLAHMDDRRAYVEWNGSGYVISTNVLRFVHLLHLAEAIKQINPKRILEVGSGNGNMLFSIAAMFPELEIDGLEKSSAGVELAKMGQATGELPAEFADYCPEKVVDYSAHARINFQQGDARQLPYPDNSFDMVITHLALEQMEAIREEAISEIARVTCGTAIMIEPWQDFNREKPWSDYIQRTGYFQCPVDDLPDFGLQPVYTNVQMPQKVQFRAGTVIAQKM